MHLPSAILGYIELFVGLILPPTRCQYLILLWLLPHRKSFADLRLFYAFILNKSHNGCTGTVLFILPGSPTPAFPPF